jgi:hypothetical protein
MVPPVPPVAIVALESAVAVAPVVSEPGLRADGSSTGGSCSVLGCSAPRSSWLHATGAAMAKRKRVETNV